MFSVHTISENFENAINVFEKKLLGLGNQMTFVTLSFSKSPVFKMFFIVDMKTKSRRFELRAFSKSSLLQVRDELVWKVDLTVDIKLGFQFSPA